jgi:dihydroxy-acid dehydratase
MILGGSTNAVLHLIAIAHSVGIKLDIDDFASVSDRVPFLADIKPSGKYVMEDVYKLGGIPSKCLYSDGIRLLANHSTMTRGSWIPAQEQFNRW